jgi:FSR family fosmidomycin resistance protein-like MFS transporter
MLGGVLIFFSSVTQPVYGYLSDRLHSRAFTIATPAIAGAFICALCLAPGFAWLAPFAIVGGSAIAAFHPQASAWAATLGSGGRGGALAIFITAGTLGTASGPIYFSAVMSIVGFDRLYWAAVPGVIVSVMLLWRMPHAHAPEISDRAGTDWSALQSVRKPLAIHYSLVFIRSVVQITYAQLLPLYLHRERGYDLLQANYVLSLYLICGAVGGFAGGHLADRFGGERVIRISFLASVPFLVLFFATTGAVSIAALCAGGCILLFTIPVHVLMAQSLAPGQTGTVSALMMGFAWGMAGLIFVPLTGWVSDFLSLHTALGALSFVPAVGFLLSLKLRGGVTIRDAAESFK